MSRRRQQTAPRETGRDAGPPRGLEAAARFDRGIRNTGDPTRQPARAKAVSIRPMAEKTRSREGVRGARSTEEGRQDKLLEGRGPAWVMAACGGKREGMGESPNNPKDKVRELQRSLWMCAKRGRAVPYPVHATPARPSVSRVRENRMHGLKGGHWKPGPAMATGA